MIAVPLTLVVTVAIVLAVTAPVVFLLSVLAGFGPQVVYIHIVIVDIALLVGIYVAGMLVSHAFVAERSRLIVPNVIGFSMMAVIQRGLRSAVGRTGNRSGREGRAGAVGGGRCRPSAVPFPGDQRQR